MFQEHKESKVTSQRTLTSKNLLCLAVSMNKRGHAGGHIDYLFAPNNNYPNTSSSGDSGTHDVIKTVSNATVT